MTLLEALKAEDYLAAAQCAAAVDDDAVRQALKDSYFMQNLHRHCGAAELFLLLEQRGIISLDLSEDAKDERDDDLPLPSAELCEALGLNTDDTPAPPQYIGKTLFDNIFYQLERGDDNAVTVLTKLLPHASGLNSNNGALLRDAIRRQLPLSVIEQLVNAGCDPSELTRAQESYLFQIVHSVAMDNGLFEAYLNFFIEQGLDLNQANIVRDTPLSVVVKQGDCAKLDLLLALGADPDREFDEGFDILETALAHGQTAVLEHLLAHGLQFDYDKRDKAQQSVLYRFLKGPGNVDLKLLALLLKGEPDLYQPNRDSYCGLQQATPIQRLLDKTPDALQLALHLLRPELNQVDENGNTALHHAASHYVNYEQRQANDIFQRVKLLVGYGADVNMRNNQGQTAADVACDDDLKIKTVEWLRAKQAIDA